MGVQCCYYMIGYPVILLKFFLLSIGIYAAIMISVVYLQYRKRRADIENSGIIKDILIISAAVICIYVFLTRESYLLSPYIATVPAVEKNAHNIIENEDGSYTIVKEGEKDFKILQLTDIHLGGSWYTVGEDHNALQAAYDLIAYTQPDLILVTGDFVFDIGLFSMSLNNYSPMMQFCSFMRNVGIPWAFVFGNHDTEWLSTSSSEELKEMLEKFSYKQTGSLLYSIKQPDITGRYNQYIKIANEDGSTNQLLFLLDSHSYLDNMTEYDYIRQDQIDWYQETVENISRQEGKTVSSMMFFHIPIEEFRTAYEAYREGAEEVVRYFGEIGEEGEAISISDHENQLFETAETLGSTKAIFVGHDHYNNLSLEYRGIRLTFGRSIDYLAMPGIQQRAEQRGATLITLKENSQFQISPVKLSDIRK